MSTPATPSARREVPSRARTLPAARQITSWKRRRSVRQMRFYDRHILPRLTHLAMSQELLRPYRQRAVSHTSGRVLEIGIGSGLNLTLYPNAVTHVVGIDPSAELLGFVGATYRGDTSAMELITASAEDLPPEDRSFDCVVASWTLCSVTDPRQALSEIRRVLKPGGIFSFVEHGLAPDAAVQKWQRRLTPVWCRCAGNCHLDRAPAALVQESGLRVERTRNRICPGPKAFRLHVRRPLTPALALTKALPVNAARWRRGWASRSSILMGREPVRAYRFLTQIALPCFLPGGGLVPQSAGRRCGMGRQTDVSLTCRAARRGHTGRQGARRRQEPESVDQRSLIRPDRRSAITRPEIPLWAESAESV